MRRAVRIVGALIILALLGFAWYWHQLNWIEAGYVGIIYDARGGIENKVYPPQALYVGPFRQLFQYPTKLQNAVYTEDPSAGEVKAADGISITTNDNANTVFDVCVLYRVEAENAIKVFKSFGQLPIEEVQSQHIRRAVREGASIVGNQYDVFQLMGPSRDEASQKLLEELRSRLGPKGITIEDALILNPHPAQDMLARVNQRVNAYILLQIAALGAQIAEIDRQTAVVKAEAEQKAAKIAASGAVAKSLAVIDLENAEAAIKKWNGHLAPLPKDGKQTIVIGADTLFGGGSDK